MNNFLDWDTAIFATVLAGYIFAGVFVGRWMDEKCFDPCRIKKDTSWREVLRALLWIFYLPVVALLVCKGVKYKYAPKSDYVPPKREPYTGYRAEPNVPEVVVPEGVTELDGRAFHSFDKLFEESCHDLQHLVIPSSVTKIAPGTFTHLYCHMPEPIPYGLESEEGYPPNTHDRLFVPKGAKEKYEATEPWNYYEIEYLEDERD